MTKSNERVFTNRRYLDAIDDHVVIFDGAMGTNIQRYQPAAPTTSAASSTTAVTTTSSSPART